MLRLTAILVQTDRVRHGSFWGEKAAARFVSRLRDRPYAVKSVRRFDRQRLPAELFTRTGPERLHLITCGGAYDSKSGYELNLVVTAAPVR